MKIEFPQRKFSTYVIKPARSCRHCVYHHISKFFFRIFVFSCQVSKNIFTYVHIFIVLISSQHACCATPHNGGAQQRCTGDNRTVWHGPVDLAWLHGTLRTLSAFRISSRWHDEQPFEVVELDLDEVRRVAPLGLVPHPSVQLQCLQWNPENLDIHRRCALDASLSQGRTRCGRRPQEEKRKSCATTCLIDGWGYSTRPFGHKDLLLSCTSDNPPPSLALPPGFGPRGWPPDAERVPSRLDCGSWTSLEPSWCPSMRRMKDRCFAQGDIDVSVDEDSLGADGSGAHGGSLSRSRKHIFHVQAKRQAVRLTYRSCQTTREDSGDGGVPLNLWPHGRKVLVQLGQLLSRCISGNAIDNQSVLRT